MQTKTTLNQSIIEAYTDQAAILPQPIRERVMALGEGEPVQLYGLADLDEALRLKPTWVVLSARHVFLIEGDNGTSAYRCIDRSQVTAVVEVAGLSSNTLLVKGDPEGPPLATLHYTQRQRRCLDNIRVALEEDRPGTPEAVAQADERYAESLAEPIRQAQAAVSGNDLAILRRLLTYLKPYRRDVLIGMSCAVLITLFNLLPPYLTGLIIDRVTGDLGGGGVSGSTIGLAWRIVGLLAGLYILRESCLWLRLKKMSTLGEFVARDLREAIYSHLQNLSLRFFNRKQTGSIISRVSSDTDRLWDFIAFGIVEVSVSILMLLGLGLVLLWMDWRLGLIMILPVPLFLWAFYRHGLTLNRIFLKAWRTWSSLTSLISGTIPGIRVVKAFNQEQREIDRFDRRNDRCLEVFNHIHVVWTSFWPKLIFAFNALTLVVWAFALPRLTGQVEPILTPGTFVAFLLYMGMFLQPLEVIGQMTRMMNRAVSSAYRVFEVLDTEPQITNIEDPVILPALRGAVRFDHVSFSYDGVRDTLKDVSFDVAPGEMIGLVGPSGSGKSTLIHLMARFYDVTKGHVLIDGEDIRNLEVGHFRRQVGIVLQDPYLFHGTILENIGYGLENPPLERIVAAARAANAHEFICKTKQGYETMVGERGQTLSGGERQRVSIARAILHDPRILILDEATSNVDTETERKIQEALDRLVEGRTVIAIAHRLSTLQRADRLLVLKDGKLVESGTHAELLADPDGEFTKLSRIQQDLHEQFAI